ncbi:tRNA pseudouridine(38-40) synthase TruA [Synechococcus sp. Nb3U1]|uniref:tRNA pseudouridine(38-40) synthase TruA n=1 Tax=Synechococcus sp. Nb3U1 TaxID=1914529 RepID=UPI001F34F2C2|nr:tRNA pseudouridine(38-40) synthase TruA [Synechococcus sp. Nb3U1]MCF2972306.1 tRNA pseudouridine(38-40) synthase TruA [Synechococcus sp. Nb3U1]
MQYRRIALRVQYLGSAFHGWQRQAAHRSVQGVLEEAIASRAGHKVILHGAGRTDAGVHAAGQMAHFDTTSTIRPSDWSRVLNACLPEDVAVLASAEVPDSWHARFSATRRRYRYLILNRERPDVFWRLFSWHVRWPLQVERMSEALNSLLGEHSLEAFRCTGSKRAHSTVQVQEVLCQRLGEMVSIEVQASGFLYRMMRLLVGSLQVVGRGELSPEGFVRLWQQNDWSQMRTRYSAPPQGLCLTDVGYAADPFGQLFAHSPPFWVLPLAAPPPTLAPLAHSFG